MADWSNGDARQVLERIPGLVTVGLHHDSPGAFAELSRAHAYQIQPQVEMKGPWLADEKLISRCPELLAICSTGSGYDVIDVEACTRAGIIVCNQAGSNREAVAEHAIGMMLALTKKIAFADKLMRRSGDIDRRLLVGANMRGKTLGIFGIGHIGTRTAELCSGLFEMTVLAYDPYISADEIRARHATKVDMDELFRRSDFVSVHCPKAEETLGLIGRLQFEAMKPTAFFVTTARGGVHDEAALAAALAEKRIAGAGVDVFLIEPPPLDHPLLAFDNVVASPHVAGSTVESLRDMALGNALQWVDIFAGRRPPRLINPEAWWKYRERFGRAFGRLPEPLDPTGESPARAAAGLA
jgi:D-3-phosphoglycerate dehydrogenase